MKHLPNTARAALSLCLAAILPACKVAGERATAANGVSRTAFTASAFMKAGRDDWTTEYNPVTGYTKSTSITRDMDQTALIKAYTNTKLAGFAKDSWLGGKTIDRAAAGDVLKAGNTAKQIDATKAVELKKLDLVEPVAAAAP